MRAVMCLLVAVVATGCGSGTRVDPPPYRVAELERVVGWEGQVGDVPDYRLWAVVGDRYLLDLRMFFGRSDPTQAMLAGADGMLAGLRVPDWGPWELDAA